MVGGPDCHTLESVDDSNLQLGTMHENVLDSSRKPQEVSILKLHDEAEMNPENAPDSEPLNEHSSHFTKREL